MLVTQGHTQSLRTNALGETIALPSDFSAHIARSISLQKYYCTNQTPPTSSIHGAAPNYVLRRTPHVQPCQACLHTPSRDRADWRDNQGNRCRHPEDAHDKEVASRPIPRNALTPTCTKSSTLTFFECMTRSHLRCSKLRRLQCALLMPTSNSNCTSSVTRQRSTT